MTDDESPVDARTSRFGLVTVWAIGSLVGVAAGIAFSIRIGSALGMIATAIVVPAVVVLVNVVRLARRRDRIRPVPELYVPGGALLILLGAREGLFGDTVRYDLNYYTSQTNSTWHAKSNVSRHSPPDRAAPGARVRARSGEGAGGQVVEGLRERLGETHWRSSDVSLDVDADVEDSYDFLPLWKSGTFDVRVHVTARWNGPQSSGSVTLDLSGTVVQTMSGIASRRRFNLKLGETIADKVAQAVNEEIDKD